MSDVKSYLLIMEDLVFAHTNVLDESTRQDCIDGYLDIIDVSDHDALFTFGVNKGVEYWTPIDSLTPFGGR